MKRRPVCFFFFFFIKFGSSFDIIFPYRYPNLRRLLFSLDYRFDISVWKFCHHFFRLLIPALPQRIGKKHPFPFESPLLPLNRFLLLLNTLHVHIGSIRWFIPFLALFVIRRLVGPWITWRPIKRDPDILTWISIEFCCLIIELHYLIRSRFILRRLMFNFILTCEYLGKQIPILRL